jgi:leader peptidase (prepilin peptidase)/N-methyltransferase
MFTLLVIFGFGCIIGSFLSVCIYRLPFASLAEEEEHEAEARKENPELISSLPSQEAPKAPFENIGVNNPKRSFCPKCLAKLTWRHNIPVISWLFLGGKCAFCKSSIPVRYPVLELFTGLTSLICYTQFGLNPTGILLFIFCCVLIVITVIDYDYYIIPNVISIPGTFIALGIGVINHFFHIFNFPVVPGIQESLIGLFSGSLFLFIIAEFYLRVRKIEGLGMGDVKLLALTGALLGYESSVYTIFVGSLLGSFIGIGLMFVGGRKFNHAIPFGPFLALACMIYVFISPDAIDKTLNLFVNLFGR